MGVTSINRRKKEFKRVKPFNRHHSDRYLRLDPSWRKPRGIDNAVRRKFRGTLRMVNIGYKNNNKTRHTIKGGFKKFLLRDPKDIELLLMNNRTHAGEIAHTISAKKRVEIINRAKELNVKITNVNGKVRKAPTE
uniref:60S ribosomal protein L32 n=1 Tax=Euplotes harpa TaxID=151035 RepID=A0A7S3J982_9SPIT|mmetsp:Transcript_23770/g.27338  ORF Transcript_23770/g.27338 Transcript_23770/m.27338 type:complete len:135 (+) Transcript_23770:40-444(+)|eukprot:CAMPEP_0168355382 /NCGR_PEP_ID=MMETSP0213-20121227/24503_1 /TAXON_ID=151035 /ORGANISM="Euplotes harpa, Strain FSP1.4" /LENGTH=134 /DNA_ID=CAMNT_0008367553 /DNA_START=26 /DNA_END=430 /DNA_ORIENTATION=-